MDSSSSVVAGDSGATHKDAEAPSRLRVIDGGAGETNEDGPVMLLYRKGDVRAFETLYTKHKGALYRYLQRMCRDRDVANDLFQEVWSRVIASRDRYEIRAQFTTFLFQIAHNCAIDHFRRMDRKREKQTEDVEEIQDRLPGAESERPEERAQESELRDAYKRALQRLPEEQRQAFVLREEGGFSLEEIGKITGVTMETAKSRLRYALSKLRSTLAAYEPKSALRTDQVRP
jgi:RNA polymerase sigma-70 factor (ECF subfamily)